MFWSEILRWLIESLSVGELNSEACMTMLGWHKLLPYSGLYIRKEMIVVQ